MMVLGLVAALGVASASQAALVGSDVQLEYPNIASYDIVTTYDASTGELKAVGWPQAHQFVDGTLNPDFVGDPGGFVLQAKINNLGEADLTSTFNKIEVSGDLGDGLGTVELLKSTKLMTFGYEDATDAGLFYFRFYNEIDSNFAKIGDRIGVILSAGKLTVNFGNDFRSSNGKADTFVPVPTAAASGLVLLGLLGVRSARRKFVKA